MISILVIPHDASNVSILPHGDGTRTVTVGPGVPIFETNLHETNIPASALKICFDSMKVALCESLDRYFEERHGTAKEETT